MASGQHRGRPPGRRWLPFGLGGAAVAGAVVIVVGITQVASPQACAAPVSLLAASAPVTGIATHYVLAAGGGNCSYPSPPSDGLFVALSPSEYDGAAACGSYLEVTGPGGSVRAEVIDQCPPCQTGHIDLSETAFAKLAPLAAGLIHVTYRVITDPARPGPVSLRVKEGSSAYWLALLPMNTGNPVASVDVRSASRGWQELTRADYNYWIAASGMGAGPFTVKVTDTLGHLVTATGIGLDPGAVQATGLPMYGTTNPAPAASTPVTPTPSPTRPPGAPVRKKPISRPAAAAVSSTPAPSAATRTSLPAPSPTATC
jgi:expansin (peptidoglycan-binding protein)